jgi:hypothetical protein
MFQFSFMSCMLQALPDTILTVPSAPKPPLSEYVKLPTSIYSQCTYQAQPSQL